MLGLSFFEVMQGQLRGADGVETPVDFQIKAEANDLSRFLRTGRARVTGVIHAPPWASEAAIEGDIEISPFLGRRIGYRMAFRDEEGVRFTLEGEKSLSLWRPVGSATELPAALCRDGAQLARGQLTFDISELFEFLGSWGPWTSFKAVDLPDDGEARGGALSAGDVKTFVALGEAVIAEGVNTPAFDEASRGLSLERLAAMPGHVRSLYRYGLKWLEGASVVRERRSFAGLAVHRRRALLDDLVGGAADGGGLGTFMPGRLALHFLSAPLKLAHFGREDYLAQIGHPALRTVAAEPEERYHRQVITAESLDAETEVEAEVVIVGTGAGGAALAASLASRGVAVALVEEGRYLRRQDFVGSPVERMDRLYRYRSMNLTVGTPIVIPQGRLVGGTTAINSGTCFRTPDAVLEEWRSEQGFPDEFAPEVFGRYLEQVERILGVEPGTKAAVGPIGDVIGRGADALGLPHGALPRNAPGCPGRGECIFGCPEGAKRSTDISFVPTALKQGAALYVGLPVTRVLMRGRRAVAIEARGADLHGVQKVLRVRAEHIVLACGSLLSPLMLLDSGIALPQLGKNLSVHPGMGMVARTRTPLAPWDTIPQGYGVELPAEEGIRFEGYYLPPSVLAAGLGAFGHELTRWMDDFGQLAQFGFMVRDGSDGLVHRGPGGRPVIRYSVSMRTQARLRKGASLMARMFLAGGASEVVPGFAGLAPVRTMAAAEALEHVPTGPMDFTLLGAHPLGTCRMGTGPDRAVVDFDCRVFGTDNLFVVDGSVLPSSLGVNPQVTIMAMALRAAERIGAG